MLQIKNFSISFLQDEKFTEVIHDISFSLEKNEILGIVGESGSGKSQTVFGMTGVWKWKIDHFLSDFRALAEGSFKK